MCSKKGKENMNAETISKIIRSGLRGLALVVAMFGVEVDEGQLATNSDAIAAGVAAALWLIPEVVGWIKAIKGKTIK
jgi:hypothetical protein